MLRKSVMIFSIFAIFLGMGCQERETPSSQMPPGALGPLQTVTANINGTSVEIEVAVTLPEQRQGLMYRESMPENHGMLFVYRQPQYLSFWMKNTRIPLSIAFIREDGVITDILDMQPHTGPFDPQEHYASTQKCIYALEMNQGWFERNGVQRGDRLDLPRDEIQRMIESKG